MKVDPPKDSNLQITHAKDLYKIMQDILVREGKVDALQEHLWIVGLDAHNRVLFIELGALGSGNVVSAVPRELFRVAVMKNAFKCMVVHNHPSGILKPSQADKEFTKRMVDAGLILGIYVVDHLIISETDYYSMEHNVDIPGLWGPNWDKDMKI